MQIGLNGVKTYVDFEVIVILHEMNPYATLLGIDWACYNDSMLNLKQQHMLFEKDGCRVIQPLDPMQGEQNVFTRGHTIA